MEKRKNRALSGGGAMKVASSCKRRRSMEIMSLAEIACFN
jgi:hypothetical protein